MGENSNKSEKKFPTAVMVTLIICATVVILTITGMFFASYSFDRLQNVVNDLPKDLQNITINLTSNN